MRRILVACGVIAVALLSAGRGEDRALLSGEAPMPRAGVARRPAAAGAEPAGAKPPDGVAPAALPDAARERAVAGPQPPATRPAAREGAGIVPVAPLPPLPLGVLGVEARGGADGAPFLRVWPSPRAARVVLSFQGREIAQRSVPQRPTAAERTVSFALAVSDAPRTLWIGEEDAAGERSPWKRVDLFEGGGTWEGR